MVSAVMPFFPHQAIREGQDQLIQDLDAAFTDGKILLAHAPTGSGKTAAALSVAVKHAIEKKKRIFFLTNRHTQHRLAIDTLRLINQKLSPPISCIDLIGKRWMCSQEVAGLLGNEFNEYCKAVVEKGECEFYNRVRSKNSLTVEAKALVEQLQKHTAFHNEELVEWGKEKRMCSYEIAMAFAKKATIVIGDYNYVFNHFIQQNLFTKIGIELEDVILIVDEGHNLPGRITDMLSSVLTSVMLKNGMQEAKKYSYGGIAGWLQEISRIILKLADFPAGIEDREKLITREQLLDPLQKIILYDNLIAELETAADEVRKTQRKSYLGGIALFLQSWKGPDEGFARILLERRGKYEPGYVLSYSCLDPSIVSTEIFRRVHAGIVMSGTLKPTFMYKDVLGIEQSREQEYRSPFPPENKLSLIIPETSTKYTLRGETMYQLIAQKCSELSRLIPGNVAFFFPSYTLRDQIGGLFRSPKKLFWEKKEMNKEEKEELLNAFRRERELGGVLLGVAGANFAEGIDLPGDLLNGVIVTGLPLAKPDLKTREVIKYYDQKFGKGWDYGYVYPAMNKCLQSTGRCIRSETDKGAIIYLDERFAWPNYYCCFPAEGLIVSKQYASLLNRFFGN